MTVSFDYDGVLSREELRFLVSVVRELGCEVVVTTARYESRVYDNLELYEVCRGVGITEECIRFCDGKPKYHRMKDIALHLDDNKTEVDSINLISEEAFAVHVSEWVVPKDLKNKIVELIKTVNHA